MRAPAGPPPAGLPPAAELHVWWLHLDDHDPRRYVGVLDEAERARAERLRTPGAYRSYVLTRAALRHLLGGYLERPRIAFRYGPQGKPALDGATDADQPLGFNVSHARARAVLAFRAGGRVGVDVEEVRSDVAGLRLAERFFSAPEAAALRALPGPEQLPGFFRCWARKEAVIKALGEGLSHDLRSFTVGVAGPAPAVLNAAGQAWRLVDLDAGPDHTAAVAVSGAAPCAVRQFPWTGTAD